MDKDKICRIVLHFQYVQIFSYKLVFKRLIVQKMYSIKFVVSCVLKPSPSLRGKGRFTHSRYSSGKLRLVSFE